MDVDEDGEINDLYVMLSIVLLVYRACFQAAEKLHGVLHELLVATRFLLQAVSTLGTHILEYLCICKRSTIGPRWPVHHRRLTFLRIPIKRWMSSPTINWTMSRRSRRSAIRSSRNISPVKRFTSDRQRLTGTLVPS